MQQTDSCKLILIVVTRNQKDVQRIQNRVLTISTLLQTLSTIVIVEPYRRTKMGERNIITKIVRNIVRSLSIKMVKIRV